MGINALTIAWFSELTKKKIIKRGSSLIDFGPQDVLSSRAAVEIYARRHVSEAKTEFILNQMFDGEKSRGIIPAHFYSIFGIDYYRSTDFIDPRANWQRDLNVNTELPEKFDIATNFGTAEHVFNVSAVFKSMHDVVHAGGLMLHILPAFGDVDHGFFNIHPTTYLDLAVANGYVVEHFRYVDRWDIRNRTLEENLAADVDFDSMPIRVHEVRDRVERHRDRDRLQRMVVERFVANYNHPKTKQFGPAFSSVLYDYCIVALRKVNDAPFRYPVQNYYDDGTARPSVPSRDASSLRWPRFPSLPWPRFASLWSSITAFKTLVRRCLAALVPKSAKRYLLRTLLKTVLRDWALDVSGVDAGLSMTERWAPFALTSHPRPYRPLTAIAMTEMMTLVEARIERLYNAARLGVTIDELDPDFLKEIRRLLASDSGFVAFIGERYGWSGETARNRKKPISEIRVLFDQTIFTTPPVSCEAVLRDFADRVATLTGVSFTTESQTTLDLMMTALEDKLEALHNLGQVSIRDVNSTALDQLSGPLRNNPRLVEYVADRYLRTGSYYRYEKSAARKHVINDLLWLIVHPPVQIPEKIGNEIIEFAGLVRNELSSQPYPPGVVVSARWQEIVQPAMRVVSHLSDPIHIAILAMARLTFDAGMPILSEDETPLRKQRAEYDRLHPELKSVGESKLALPGTVLDIDGLTFSDNLAQAFGYYHEIFSGLGAGTKTDVVVEVGSGFGKLARLLRLSGKSRCMVLVDLPESLALSFAFLKVNFPNARTHVIRSASDVTANLADQYDFIFCPIQQLDNLKFDRIDLLVNTYSLAEMQQGSVDHILRCVHSNLKPEHLFSLNTIFTDKNLHFAEGGTLGQGNEIVLKLEPEWWPLHINLYERPEGDRYRTEESIVFERSSLPPLELIQRYLNAAGKLPNASPDRLIYMFFAALWTTHPKVIEEFLRGLRQYHIDCGFAEWNAYDFEKIGEVKFLRRRLATLTGKT